MTSIEWINECSSAFRLMLATSWLAPDGRRPEQKEAIRRACSAGPDWDEYLCLVDRHRIPAMSWASLKCVPDLCLQENVVRELRRRSDACRMQSMLRLHLLAGVLRRFNRASIPVMPLKGPLLSIEMYGDPGLRQSKDLDILVRREHVAAAQACLEETGWSRCEKSSILTQRQLEFNMRHEHHTDYVHARTDCELELHWRTVWESPEEAGDHMDRSLTAEWQGCTYQAMDRIDLTLYLCNHGSNHAWFRAKWLGDLARIHAAGSVDWMAALTRARQSGAERPLLLCLRLLEDAYRIPAPSAARNSIRALPPVLIGKSIRELITLAEPCTRGSLASLLDRFRNARFSRRLWPARSLWESIAAVALCPADIKLLCLPDRLFWLYLPLRPFLWIWRRVRDFLRESRVRAGGGGL